MKLKVKSLILQSSIGFTLTSTSFLTKKDHIPYIEKDFLLISWLWVMFRCILNCRIEAWRLNSSCVFSSSSSYCENRKWFFNKKSVRRGKSGHRWTSLSHHINKLVFHPASFSAARRDATRTNKEVGAASGNRRRWAGRRLAANCLHRGAVRAR